jgi:hypothetical protein
MKQGKSLTELATTLEHQLETKKDYIVQSNALQMRVEDQDSFLTAGDFGWGMNDIAHGQLSEFTKIPKPYYDRMRISWPALLASNVNHWLGQASGKRLVRTMEGGARALLSDKYRPLDNYDLAEAALPVIQESGAKIESCEITERKMYLKTVFPKFEGDIKQGDPVQLGMVISNSEVGCGSLAIRPLIYRLVCTNGMISEDYSMRKHHVGRLDTDNDITAALFSSDTLAADNKAFFLKVRDLIQHVLTKEVFEGMIVKIREAAGIKITRNPVDVVQEISTNFGMSQAESGGVLRHLVEGGDLSKWGLVNAVTRFSQDVDSYDRATELESLGGKIIELNPTEWRVLAEEKKAS